MARMPPAARARIALVSSGDSPDSSAYPATVAMVHTTPTAVQTPMMYARERPSSRIAAALARLSGTLPRKTTASSTSPRPGPSAWRLTPIAMLSGTPSSTAPTSSAVPATAATFRLSCLASAPGTTSAASRPAGFGETAAIRSSPTSATT